jgi:membrane protein implicated in regulation of membrane protease activity
LEKVMLFAAFDPTSVYAGVGTAFEGALVVAASLTAALIIYRWVRRVFGR